MKTFVSVTFLLACASFCLALPQSSTQTRGPARIKQTTPIPTTNHAISSSSSTSSSPSTTSQTPSITPATNVEQRIKNIDQTTSSSIQTRKSSTPSIQEVTSSTVNQQQTTLASLAKETRESTGKNRPQIKITTNFSSIGETNVRLPEGASAALAKPTKYHYYPHNQHIYLLPECAVQQVCNAVYVRLNFTQPLCACPGRYRDPCSASLDSNDLHTTELVTDPRTRALTLVKTCEPVVEMRECRAPRDWSLLALQNVRTGKSHYLVICRCPDTNILEGPMSHDQPTYASVPGIRVYGMICVQGNRRGRPLRHARNLLGLEAEVEDRENLIATFPWHRVPQLMETASWD
ncbi:uncharacterized protein F26C11.3 [Venturia canescens]|uniref:uncharacterized protein F26C11.3 n=1 Tax=Venturia canescens TaxID=32260 RepID=UPI001C9D4782|nr:uncharacterized protein F26C11.3 [Venturia canescens]